MTIGAKTQFDKTFLTSRAVYREAITTADTGPDVNGIPEIRLDVQELIKNQTAYYQAGGHPPRSCNPQIRHLTPGNRLEQRASADRAYNGHLELFVWFTPPAEGCQDVGPQLIDGVLEQGDQRCHATLRVWIWGGEEDVDPIVGPLPDDDHLDESLSSSSLSDAFGRWCLVHEQSVVCDTFIPLRDVPAGRYRVTVDELSAGSEVDILEQHTE